MEAKTTLIKIEEDIHLLFSPCHVRLASKAVSLEKFTLGLEIYASNLSQSTVIFNVFFQPEQKAFLLQATKQSPGYPLDLAYGASCHMKGTV